MNKVTELIRVYLDVLDRTLQNINGFTKSASTSRTYSEWKVPALVGRTASEKENNIFYYLVMTCYSMFLSFFAVVVVVIIIVVVVVVVVFVVL